MTHDVPAGSENRMADARERAPSANTSDSPHPVTDTSESRPTWGPRAALEVVWVACALVIGIWYLGSRWEEVREYTTQVGGYGVLLSLVAVTIGRIVVAAVSRSAVRTFGVELKLSTSFFLNAASQLGKYLPGGIWHFVGRVALYRRYGLPALKGSAVLALENTVLVASAACLGVALSFAPLTAALGRESGWPTASIATSLTVGVVAWWLLAAVFAPYLAKRLGAAKPLPRLELFTYGVLCWSFFGLALWSLLPLEGRTLALLPAATGAFALAWSAGYLSPFAPAGVGVREAIIVALLGPSIGVPGAVGAAIASRIIWTLQEVGLAPVAAHRLSGSEPPA